MRTERRPKPCGPTSCLLALATLALAAAQLPVSATAGEPYRVPLNNPAFTDGADGSGVPRSWVRYGGGGVNQKLAVTTEDDGRSTLLIADGDPTAEIGVSQSFDLKGGETYEVAVRVRGVLGASTAGAYVQLRFLPADAYVQADLAAASSREFSEVTIRATAPPNTTRGTLYLYTHRDPTPQVVVADVRLHGGLPAPPEPPPPPPAPVPPQYDKLKDLHREIALVRNAAANAVIVAPALAAYQAAAERIRQAIEARTGVSLPIVSDDSAQAGVPIRQHVICLGNRSTNKTLNALYDHFYCLVDLKYPGPGGYVIRTVHSPYGNGNSVVIVGGSDGEAVDEGAKALGGILSKAPYHDGLLSMGWTMETHLAGGTVVPTDVRDFETWDASRGYGSIGYFGWCSISKHMAMYYMTGNETSAREFIRLSFPDEQALRDIETIDGERIENKLDPLAGFYHYNAHMAILLWDLIEESPVFSDEQRLKITNAFARQLNHRKGEGVYGLTGPASSVGSRHGQWSAISLYCLGRYFHKDYSHPIWAQCVRGGELAFASLHKHAWVDGENDNLFWYCTGIAPIFTYMTLTGDRRPLENGVVGQLLLGQEALISGRPGDWALDSASIGMLNSAAYLTGDGRWIAYRDRTGVDTDIFRLGQSFWPDDTIVPRQPEDLAGRWTVSRLPEPAWAARGSGLPFDQSFNFASFRSQPDGSGDYILLDGFNGASRNPYHTLDVLQLRLNGQTVLDGYHNQVQTSADGMVEPAVAMDARLVHADVVGSTAIAVGEVPRAAFCNWRRTLVQRVGRYAIIVDDLTFRADSRNMAVTTTWQIPGGRWDVKQRVVRGSAGELRSCDVQEAEGGGIVTMKWNGSVKADMQRLAFYLVSPAIRGSTQECVCARVAGNAAAVALPQAALVVAGQHGQTNAAMAVLAEDHLSGHALTRGGTDAVLVSSESPIDIDWDFQTGTATIVARQATALRLNAADSGALRVDGQPVASEVLDASVRIALPEGRHVVTGVAPATASLSALKRTLQSAVATGQALRGNELAAAARPAELPVAAARLAMAVRVDGPVTDLISLDAPDGARLAVAAGNAIHVLNADGEQAHKLETEGAVRVLHWWAAPQLLLAGCVDEKVVAFDSGGQRGWTFTSEMDPAVATAGKTYWFKSAPGHEGIHGLYSGTFDGDESRCFVGSACTLEVLDQAGNLVKRLPVFWGPGRKFLLADGEGGARNLLVSQWPNGSDSLAIIDGRSLTVSGHGYDGVPPGHSYVGGWTAQNRTGLFLVDLDGDGTQEVATAVNGTWNRVTVYSRGGKPLHNAQLGPGLDNTPRSRVRDMDVGDLTGDGRKEMLVGLSEGLVLCLDATCRPVWSTRLPSAPVSLRCVGTSSAQVVVGCDDGTAIAIDPAGRPTRIGQVIGRPTHMETYNGTSGAVVVLATDKGDVKGFTLSPDDDVSK